MNTLTVKVMEEVIGQDKVSTVDLRVVHTLIGSKRQFADWAKDRLQDFTESVDYAFITRFVKHYGEENLSLGTTYKDYLVTLDTAKHICMLERNQKGKELRQYFIDVERAHAAKLEREEQKKLAALEEQTLALEELKKQSVSASGPARYTTVRCITETFEGGEREIHIHCTQEERPGMYEALLSQAISVYGNYNAIIRKLKDLGVRSEDLPQEVRTASGTYVPLRDFLILLGNF